MKRFAVPFLCFALLLSPSAQAREKWGVFCGGLLAGASAGFTVGMLLMGHWAKVERVPPVPPAPPLVGKDQGPLELDRDMIEVTVLELELAAALNAGLPLEELDKSRDKALEIRDFNLGRRTDYDRAYGEIARLQRRIEELERELAEIQAKLAGQVPPEEGAILRVREARIKQLLLRDRRILVVRIGAAAGKKRELNGQPVVLTAAHLNAWKYALLARIRDLRVAIVEAQKKAETDQDFDGLVALDAINKESQQIGRTLELIEATLQALAPAPGPGVRQPK